jgi:phage protein U
VPITPLTTPSLVPAEKLNAEYESKMLRAGKGDVQLKMLVSTSITSDVRAHALRGMQRRASHSVELARLGMGPRRRAALLRLGSGLRHRAAQQCRW